MSPQFSDLRSTERAGDTLQVSAQRALDSMNRKRESRTIDIEDINRVQNLFHRDTVRVLKSQLSEAAEIQHWERDFAQTRTMKRSELPANRRRINNRNVRAVAFENSCMNNFKFPETNQYLVVPNLPRLVSYREACEMTGKKIKNPIAAPTPLTEYSVMITTH